MERNEMIDYIIKHDLAYLVDIVDNKEVRIEATEVQIREHLDKETVEELESIISLHSKTVSLGAGSEHLSNCHGCRAEAEQHL